MQQQVPSAALPLDLASQFGLVQHHGNSSLAQTRPAGPPGTGQAGLLPRALFVSDALAEAAAESCEAVDTPASANEAVAQQLRQERSNAAAPAAAVAAVLPPPPLQCLFCGGLGTQEVCGPLRLAACDGHTVAVHHLCALWSPSVYQPQVGARPTPGG